MRLLGCVAMTLVAACLVAAGTANAAIPSGNLLGDPGAEAGSAATTDIGRQAPPFPWLGGRGSELTQVQYGVPGLVSQAVGSAVGGGNAFFAGGPASSGLNSASQRLDMSAAAAEIDGGRVTATLSALLGGLASEPDAATVTATFDSPLAGSLGRVSIGPVTAADRNDETTLLPRSAAAAVPPGTRTVGVQIVATGSGGAYNDGYADNVSLTLAETGATPPPGGGGGGGGSPGSSPGGAQQRARAIGIVGPTTLVARQLTRLTAQTTGPVRGHAWDLTGDGTNDVTCGALPSVVFRPQVAGTVKTSLTVADGLGPAPSLQKVEVVAPAPAPKFAKQKVPPMYTCEGAPVQSNRQTEVECSRVAHMAFLEISGCLERLTSLSQLHDRADREALVAYVLPRVRRGLLGSKLPSDPDDPRVRADVTGYLAETDAYVTASATVNGVDLNARGKAKVIVYPQINAILSSNASFATGGIRLNARKDFLLDTTIVKGSRIPLGGFTRSGGLGTIGGFGIGGDVGVTLVPGGAQLRLHLRLADSLSLLGVPALADAQVRVTPTGEPVLDGVQVGPFDATLGGSDGPGLEDLTLTYTGAQNEWRGTGRACLGFDLPCLDVSPATGGRIVFRDGQFQEARASIVFPVPVTIGPGVDLRRIGFGVALDPTRLIGSVGLRAVDILDIDGGSVLAFGSPTSPYVLGRDDVKGFPNSFYGRRFDRLVLAAGADVSLALPGPVPNLKLASGYFLYKVPDYVALGGGVDEDFFGIVQIRGGIDGEFNSRNGRFSIAGHAQVCVADVACGGALAAVSSGGVGGCLDLGAVSVGGGVQWPNHVFIWPLDGCKWTRFTADNVFSAQARAAAGPRPYVVTVKRGDPSRAIRLDGPAGAPAVRVTGPGGVSVESSPGPGIRFRGAVRVVRSLREGLTVVGLQDPPPGTYTLEPLSPSPFTRVSTARDPGAAKITAKVEGREATRTLRYDVRRRPDQRVEFWELGPGGGRLIGAVSGGGRGRLRFTPAPGKGTRTIQARVALSGVPAERLTVARFAPPSPVFPKITGLALTRKGGTLRAAWDAVAGATGYEVVIARRDGVQRRVRSRRARVSAKVAATSGGTVRVRATAALRTGAPASASFRAARKAKTRFGALPTLGPRRGTGRARSVVRHRRGEGRALSDPRARRGEGR